MKKRELLIIGCGRSGTKYTAQVLNNFGVDAGHEIDATQCIVSWPMTIENSATPFGPSCDDYDFKHIIHQVRNPVNVIASTYTFAETSWQYIRQYVSIKDDDSMLVKCAKYWYYWNIMAERRADMTYRIENFENVAVDICSMAGVEKIDVSKVNQKSKKVNARTHNDISLNDVRNEDERLFNKIVILAKKYGYSAKDLDLDERIFNSLSEDNILYVTANMATYPARIKSFKIAVSSLLPQIDQLNVYLNGYEEVPDFLEHSKINCVLGKEALGDMRAKGKFFFLDKVDTKYYFTVDDDIEYPNDYVEKMISVLNKHHDDVVVGVHGEFYHQDFQSYTQSMTVMYFAHEVQSELVISTLGTGTLVIPMKLFANLSLDDFHELFMVDIFFAIFCKNNNIARVCVDRPELWLKSILEHNEDASSIWNDAKKNDSKQTEKIIEHKLWKLDKNSLEKYVAYLEINNVQLTKDFEHENQQSKKQSEKLYIKDTQVKEAQQQCIKQQKIIKKKNNQIKQIRSSKSFRLGDLFFRSVKRPYKLITLPANCINILLKK